jgi:uncharacterized protein (TIGR02284 family)
MSQDDVIACLNTLIETSKDGEYGFRTSADQATDAQLKQLFLQRADECRDAATELQALVRDHGGTAEDSGTAAGAMHRGWVAVKSKLSGYTDLAVLEDVERGEDKAVGDYRDVLGKALPPGVRAVLERQFEGVKRNHAQVRALRDQARTLKA